MGEGSSTIKGEVKEDDTISMISEMSRMSFETVRHSVDQSMSLGRTIIGYKTRTVSQPIDEDEFVKNMTLEIYYEVASTNPDTIYILINICLKGYNGYELCTHIDGGCSVYFEKRCLFP